MKKKNILVLIGGKSPEHEISLISGMEVVRNLNAKKYSIIPVIISKSGRTFQLVSIQKLLSSKDPLSKKRGIQKAQKNYIKT